MHVCDPDNTDEHAPPFAAGVVTVRDCVCVPPPHVAVHVDHADQALSTHGVGQAGREVVQSWK